ncbi:MAG TPA: hypothetical protein VMY99_04850 [Nevskiaceae bacterium]|nr:hypothetical protein [Nevskiaceae bacterium]
MHDDLPAFVRKSFGVQSTLSLVPIKINDSIHPPGSLLNLDALYRPGHGASSVRANRLDRRGVEEIIGIGFLRLSQLAYPCSERRVGDIVHNGYPDYMLSDPEEALLTNLEPEDLQSFVHEAITPKHITVHKVARAVGRLIPT